LRILVVPTSDWIGHPTPSRLHHIFEKLAERNEVHVLRFRLYSERKLTTKTIVHEVEQFDFKGLAAYYIVNAPRHFSSVRKIIKENHIDTVVVSNLLAGYMAAKASKGLAAAAFDLSDYFPTSGAGYYFSIDSILGRVATQSLESLLKKTLELVSETVTCSYPLQDYVKRLGVRNVCVIANGVDEFFLESGRRGDEIREEFGLDGHVAIGYLGSIEFWLDMHTLLRALHSMKSKGLKVKLFLVGAQLRTSSAHALKDEMKGLGIEDSVVWLNSFVPYRDVPNYIDAMDICTIPFDRNNPTAYYSAPNKLWEYLALKKPVITTPIPDPMMQAGQYIDVAWNSQDYVRIVQDYIKDPDRYREKASSATGLVLDLLPPSCFTPYISVPDGYSDCEARQPILDMGSDFTTLVLNRRIDV